MKKNINKYCSKVQKETEKLLYKLFGKKDTIKNYLQLKKQLKDEIESDAKKSINAITVNDFRNKPYGVGYKYCKYRTLDRVLNVYTTIIELNLINKVED